jgi:hypothetical protein
MDGRQLVVQRTRELFGDRLDDVIHMVRQDRQELRGWEEPAHLRSVVRRTLREGGGPEPEEAETAVATLEFGRTAGELDRGQQREGIGQLLEAGAAALEKVSRQQTQDLSAPEILGLEAVLLLYGRPALLVSQNRFGSPPPLWNILEDQREEIERTQRGVGRIELFGQPDYDWAGTGFLVSETALLTTRRTVELFCEPRNGQWQFRPGITAWMNYRSQYQRVASAGYRIRSVLGVHDQFDLALLEVEPPQPAAGAPVPLALASQPPQRLEGRPVYLVGYPVRDARRNEPESIARVFRDVYNVKRVQPGILRSMLQFRDTPLVQHDCANLGQLSGSPLVDLETHRVLGLHLAGRYLETGTAVPLWQLRDDPLFRRAGVTFTEGTARDFDQVVTQLERLKRTRHWNEVRAAINNLYQRAFGSNLPPGARNY